MSEIDRIVFLIERDGMDRARAWCMDAARTYRKVALSRFSKRPTHTLYRRQLISSYLELKRFALTGQR